MGLDPENSGGFPFPLESTPNRIQSTNDTVRGRKTLEHIGEVGNTASLRQLIMAIQLTMAMVLQLD